MTTGVKRTIIGVVALLALLFVAAQVWGGEDESTATAESSEGSEDISVDRQEVSTEPEEDLVVIAPGENGLTPCPATDGSSGKARDFSAR